MMVNHTTAYKTHCKKLTHSLWKKIFTQTEGVLSLVTLSLLKSSERKYFKMFSYADFAGKLDFAS